MPPEPGPPEPGPPGPLPSDPASFSERGWVRLGPDAALRSWTEAVRPLALALARDPAHAARWLRAGGTWFAGVGLLPNDGAGAVPGGPPLPGWLGAAVARLTGLPAPRWDRGQVSVCHPGYPRPGAGEGAGAFRYRRDADALHLDGLLPEGPERRRFLREHHGFLLGLPLVAAGPRAAPFVLREGSHRLVRAALAAVLDPVPPADWARTDLTEAYHGARRTAVAACPRVTLHGSPGEAWLVHRHLLHGTAPWPEGAPGPAEGRAILWFRPDPFPGAAPSWWPGP